jgi:hypothetical protein
MVGQVLVALVRWWPGTIGSLVLALRVLLAAAATLLLLGIGHVMAGLPWAANALLAAAACVGFAYFFERGEDEMGCRRRGRQHPGVQARPQ